MTNNKQPKKGVKKVHCSNNITKVENGLRCDWCFQGDKRRDKIFYNCRSYFFHLTFCAKNTIFPLSPTLDQKKKELQKFSDKIILGEKN